MDITQKALFVIQDNIKDAKMEITPENLLQDLEIDSITFIKIIVALESEFDFEFEDEKLLFTAFPKVKDMIDYVISRKEEETI